ncbi:unnamed protein product, partial [Iphiclides podalirius]
MQTSITSPAHERVVVMCNVQVMCNAAVQWVAWRAGPPPARAVRVGEVYVGRVRHRASHLLGPVLPPRCRCHVLMFGRPVAFHCYELLVADET